ncbi:hypothetical protein EMPS_02752 [Entomortierella parvispora]|uniref:Amino acid permease/ SLC12A domain-containing protein n=1 Tax=Entomortierella parvispora TaxID=205924 RepID=A0A9P3LTV7_9FUNG|nr:hypothetical protein EMPS_02752 [Entomortierella parvispora]
MDEKYDEGVAHDKYDVGHMQDADVPHLAKEQEGLKRDLRLRHMVMIAVSGTIGTGLFLTSGKSIFQAGPAGALLAYVLVGLWLVFVCQAIGEVATLLPLPGAFNAWGGRVFDEAFSFQMTWMYFINWALTIPSELSASAIIVKFWLPADSNFPVWVVPLLIIIVMVFINLVGVKAYGELEYWFSILKVLTIIIFIICGILVDAGAVGGHKYGMDAWHGAGTPFKGGFLGFIGTLVNVGYAYGGTEMTGVTAAESRNPHKHVPKAVNTVLVRIAFFYIVSVFLIASIIRNDDPQIANANGTASGAPFTLVFVKAGMSGAANYMNAVVFTSVFSAINSDFYVATRMLLSLARNGWAHSIIGYTNSRGVPLVALAIVTLCSCLSLLTIFIGSSVVFNWFVSVIGSIIFQSWIFILMLHFRFRYCWKKQGRSISELPYVSWGYPYGNIFALILGTLIIIATCYLSVIDPPHRADFDNDTDFNSARDTYAQNLLGAWFPWVCSLFLYVGYKIVRKTPFIRAEDADLDTGRFIPTEADKQDLIVHGPWWKRVISFLI